MTKKVKLEVGLRRVRDGTVLPKAGEQYRALGLPQPPREGRLGRFSHLEPALPEAG